MRKRYLLTALLSALALPALTVTATADDGRLEGIDPLSPADRLWFHERFLQMIPHMTADDGLSDMEADTAYSWTLQTTVAMVNQCGALAIPSGADAGSPYPGTLMEALNASWVEMDRRYAELGGITTGPCAGGPEFRATITGLAEQGIDANGLADTVTAMMQHIPNDYIEEGQGGELPGIWLFATSADELEHTPPQPPEWLTGLVQVMDDRIHELRQTRLMLAVAEENQEEIVWALIDLAELEYAKQFAEETAEFLTRGVPLSAPPPVRNDLFELDGCWLSYDGIFEIEVDGDVIFARDAFGGLWSGMVEPDGLLLTQDFRNLAAYKTVALRLAGGFESAELDAITSTLFNAGVQHQISIHVSDDLSDVQMLEAEFSESLVAEPVVGAAAPTYTAVDPAAAVHGTIWQFQHTLARVPGC